MLKATVIDPDTDEYTENFDLDKVLDELETTLGMSEAQAALYATFVEYHSAWELIKPEIMEVI